jgi:Kef-type K+ transport system membrane component KefB/mannitol/fructose-specific phosphotransferase system IIA component (Ntr-type)
VPIISKKLKIPTIIGFIIAGIIVGPHTIGILERDQAIKLLGAIGLLYIMFLSGLEIDLQQFKKNKFHGITFGLITFSIPLFLGIILGLYFFRMNLLNSVLLASMFSSHTLLTYPVVSSSGLVKNKSVTTSIGGTILTDLLALMILAFITGSTKGEINLFFGIKYLIMTLVFILFIFFLVPKITSLFFKNFSNENYMDFVYVIAILFLSGSLAYISGYEPIIGAFLAGLTLNNFIPENSLLMNRIKFFGESLFIPFFLISIGMLVDFGSFIADKHIIFISIGMTVTAVTSKYFASLISGIILRYKKMEILLMYGMSVNQAAATLAAVLIGYQLGLFDKAIISGTILMILVTTIIGAWTTKYSVKKLSDNIDELEDYKSEENERLLIPLKNNNNLNELVNFISLIRNKKSGDPIYPLHIVYENPELDDNILFAEKKLASPVNKISALNIPVVPVIKVDTNVADGVAKASVELRISTIVMAWNKLKFLSFNKTFFGSITDQIIKKTKQMIILTKISNSINICNKIIIVLPELIEKHCSLYKITELISKLAIQLTTKIYLISNKNNSIYFKELLTKNKLNNDIIINPYENIRQFYNNLNNELKLGPNDIFIMVTPRDGQISWQPVLNKIPDKVVSCFPDTNMLIIYPETGKYEEVNYKSDLQNYHDLLLKMDKDDFYFNFKKNDINDALIHIINNKFKKSAYKEQYIKKLILAAEKEAIQLSQNIVLIHEHFDTLKEAKIFFAINRNKFKLNGLAVNPDIVIIIMASKSQPSEKHLLTLTQISKIVQDKEIIKALLKSRKYRDFIDTILLK